MFFRTRTLFAWLLMYVGGLTLLATVVQTVRRGESRWVDIVGVWPFIITIVLGLVFLAAGYAVRRGANRARDYNRPALVFPKDEEEDEEP